MSLIITEGFGYEDTSLLADNVTIDVVEMKDDLEIFNVADDSIEIILLGKKPRSPWKLKDDE